MNEKTETFFEKCHHCDSKVELTTKFKRHQCPDCKKWIKPCALCDLDLVDCDKCYL